MFSKNRPKWVKKAPKLQRFWGRKRKKPCHQIVLHESVTTSVAATVRVLKKRGLSVHYMIDRAGNITEHCNPSRRCAHAGKLNDSIGVECVNRYYGSKAKSGDDVITAKWAHKGQYIMPTLEQVESCWRLIKYLTTRYDVPLVFPGVENGHTFRWGNIKHFDVPGIQAHHRSSMHSDALAVECYAVLRYGGMPPERAFATMRALASSGKRVTALPVELVCEHWGDK